MRLLSRAPRAKAGSVSFRNTHPRSNLTVSAQIPRKNLQIFIAQSACCSQTLIRQSDLAHTHRWTDMAKKPEAKPKEAAPKSTGKATADKGKKGGKK
jgi:hypothetical protein